MCPPPLQTLAVSGLGVVGRDHYGVFPLRGKLLNTREATHNQVRGGVVREGEVYCASYSGRVKVHASTFIWCCDCFSMLNIELRYM